jgi:hypothetical protein
VSRQDNLYHIYSRYYTNKYERCYTS